jgi:hypothetical protein
MVQAKGKARTSSAKSTESDPSSYSSPLFCKPIETPSDFLKLLHRLRDWNSSDIEPLLRSANVPHDRETALLGVGNAFALLQTIWGNEKRDFMQPSDEQSPTPSKRTRSSTSTQAESDPPDLSATSDESRPPLDSHSEDDGSESDVTQMCSYHPSEATPKDINTASLLSLPPPLPSFTSPAGLIAHEWRRHNAWTSPLLLNLRSETHPPQKVLNCINVIWGTDAGQSQEKEIKNLKHLLSKSMRLVTAVTRNTNAVGRSAKTMGHKFMLVTRILAGKQREVLRQDISNILDGHHALAG